MAKNRRQTLRIKIEIIKMCPKVLNYRIEGMRLAELALSQAVWPDLGTLWSAVRASRLDGCGLIVRQ